MAEELLTDTSANRAGQYALLTKQLDALLEGENDPIANMANVAAALQQTFQFLWVGFYRVVDDALVLGPFQGPIACTRIDRGKGVCGTSYERGETIVVPDVEAFPGHIACSSASKSEVVIPVRKNGEIIAVLDVDSEVLNYFTDDDVKGLEESVAILEQHL